ncbi:MAG: glycoside hydrolase family 3 protein [Halobacteriovoraceae bacterium]|nr:glycoside hydrolase family 3 protein [Halobacteriovoraceae bacterium]MCB9095216.1 glycoside hydrolase family 3 protein [Halobacteriovoraceae bacterium]
MKYIILISTLLSFNAFSFNCSYDGQNYLNKITQLLIVSYDNDLAFKKYMKKYHFGGIIGFSKTFSSFPNTNELKKTLQDLENYTSQKLFLTIDHEGGLVQRLKSLKGMSYIPSARLIGEYLKIIEIQDGLVTALDHAKMIGEIMGSELASAGLNWNFAPVADVNYNPQNKVIGKLNRAYSSDTIDVSHYISEIIHGMQDYLIATAKHFPGHGRTANNSHQNASYVYSTYQEIYQNELIPFQAAIANGVQSIMIGHLMYPNIDSKLTSLSTRFINKILLNELNFDGLVVSDDFTMGALGFAMGVPPDEFRQGLYLDKVAEAISQSLKAGMDLIILSKFSSGRQDLNVVEHLCQQLQTDHELRSTLLQKYQKVLHFKKQQLNFPSTSLTTDQLQEHYEFIQSIVDQLVQEFGKSYVQAIEPQVFHYYL